MITWLDMNSTLLVHQELVDRYGGDSGIRDRALLESALARPLNLNAYENCEDVLRLAASYAFGISRNHPFIDGNKRTAFGAMFIFLRQNGVSLVAEQDSATEAMLALATGAWDEHQLADWLKANTR